MTTKPSHQDCPAMGRNSVNFSSNGSGAENVAPSDSEHVDGAFPPVPDLRWHSAAQDYLRRLGGAEYQIAIRARRKAGKRQSTYRHSPSEYMHDLIALLNRNDEEGFKALKTLQGYNSALGF